MIVFFIFVKGDGCGYIVFGFESGIFAFINYSYIYFNSIVCEWEIRVRFGDRVRFRFGDFDIEDFDFCYFNYLRIYNGIGVSRIEIGRKFFCKCLCNILLFEF